jgi:ADP-ribosyl-[dinitrogen reductase] hydrolase
MGTRTLVYDLLAAGALDLPGAEHLNDPPPPLPAGVDLRDRVEGMLLGLAVGDALGRPSEGLTPTRRRERFGEIRDYLPVERAGNRCVGLPSDDSQLAFWTLEHLLEHDGILPDRLAETFATGPIRGIGQSMLRFVVALKRGRSWVEAAQPSAGNGALMRIAPVVVPHLHRPSSALWSDTVILARLSHDDAASTASCLAFVRLLWTLLGSELPFPRGEWLRVFLEEMRRKEGDGTRYRTRTPNLVHDGPVWRFAAEQVERALEEDLPAVHACNRWHSGAYLLETVPSVLYLLVRHGDDPEEAIVRAVNDTKDNDTVAAIVRAAVGALHGRRALPNRWIEGLSGRTREDDDGRIFELIGEALARWIDGWAPDPVPPAV